MRPAGRRLLPLPGVAPARGSERRPARPRSRRVAYPLGGLLAPGRTRVSMAGPPSPLLKGQAGADAVPQRGSSEGRRRGGSRGREERSESRPRPLPHPHLSRPAPLPALHRRRVALPRGAAASRSPARPRAGMPRRAGTRRPFAAPRPPYRAGRESTPRVLTPRLCLPRKGHSGERGGGAGCARGRAARLGCSRLGLAAARSAARTARACGRGRGRGRCKPVSM